MRLRDARGSRPSVASFHATRQASICLRCWHRPLDDRQAAVRLVQQSQSMGGFARSSHVHQPGRTRIRGSAADTPAEAK